MARSSSIRRSSRSRATASPTCSSRWRGSPPRSATRSRSRRFPARLSATTSRPGSTSGSSRSRTGFSANAQVGVEIHELAHALVRCDRREEDPKLTYAEEEVVVECVAHTVCATVGLDTAGWSVPYMATWGEGDEIARYAELIDRLATRLEDAALAVGAPVTDEELVAV